jgi:hypothetical protein
MENAAWDAIASARSMIDAALFARGDYINSPSSINEFWDFFQRFHAAKSRRQQRAPDSVATAYNPRLRINFEINAKRKPAPEDASVVREAQYVTPFPQCNFVTSCAGTRCTFSRTSIRRSACKKLSISAQRSR